MVADENRPLQLRPFHHDVFADYNRAVRRIENATWLHDASLADMNIFARADDMRAVHQGFIAKIGVAFAPGFEIVDYQRIAIRQNLPRCFKRQIELVRVLDVAREIVVDAQAGARANIVSDFIAALQHDVICNQKRAFQGRHRAITQLERGARPG